MKTGNKNDKYGWDYKPLTASCAIGKMGRKDGMGFGWLVGRAISDSTENTTEIMVIQISYQSEFLQLVDTVNESL